MKYQIEIDNQLIEVSEEVYRTYHQMRNHEDYLNKKDKRNGLTYYQALDNHNLLGVDIIEDKGANVLDAVIKQEEQVALKNAIAKLKKRDKELIEELYFNEQTERELAKRLGVSHQTVHKKKVRILKKLREILKI